MSETDYVWAGIILVGAAFETYALRRKQEGDTLSEATRKLFRVRTHRSGKIIFAALWISFATWYTLHILDVLP